MKLNSPSLDFVLWGAGEGEEECLFLRKTAVIKLICCFVFELAYLTFITAATNLPILEGYFSLNVRKNSKFKFSFQFHF